MHIDRWQCRSNGMVPVLLEKMISFMESPFLTWSDEYAIGHEKLDAEHRELVQAINNIFITERTGEQLKPLLDSLAIAAVNHFRHENTLLRDISNWVSRLQVSRPDFSIALSAEELNEHCAEHAQALLGLESIIHAFYSGVDSDRKKLAGVLRDWFREHALKHDASLRDILEAYSGTSETPCSE